MINLLPYKEKKSIERIRGLRIGQMLAVGAVILSISSGLLLLPTLITVNSRFAIADKQIQILEEEGMIASSIDLSALESRARVVKEKLSMPEVFGPTEHIEIIRSSTPKGISINNFTTNDGILLEVFGMAQSREVLQGFIKSLETHPRVALVDSPVSNFIKNKNGTFKLTISFK